MDKKNIWKLFDKIASRYDLLNRIFSFGIDVGWRKSLRKFLPVRNNLKLLDLATGTADQIIYLMEKGPEISSALGIDLSEKMLEIGKKKVARKNLQAKVELRQGDVTRIGVLDHSFDVVTMSFGIRNVENVSRCLSEIYRILAPGGKALILELSLPENLVFRNLYFFYFRHIMPLVGGLLAGNIKAYRYLVNSTENFFSPEEFQKLMRQAGLKNIKAHRFSMGIAWLYEGELEF